MVKTCHIHSKTVNILLILHVYSDLVRRIEYFYPPPSPPLVSQNHIGQPPSLPPGRYNFTQTMSVRP